MEFYFDKGHTEGDNEYNIWYHKYYGHGTGRKQGEEKEPATTRCDTKKDCGWTKGFEKNDTYICCFFARGCCALGPQCTYIHLLPTDEHEKSIDELHDCFGRERHGTDKTDMAGVGNFNRECKALYVGCIKCGPGDNPDEVVFRHFYEWGDISYVRTVPERGFAYVKYKNRTAAEFAKMAMDGQSLDNNEAIDIKWALEDPSAEFWAEEQMATKARVERALLKKGISPATMNLMAQAIPQQLVRPSLRNESIRHWDDGSLVYVDGQVPADKLEAAQDQYRLMLQAQQQRAEAEGEQAPGLNSTNPFLAAASAWLLPGVNQEGKGFDQVVTDFYINSDDKNNFYNKLVGPINYNVPHDDPRLAVSAEIAATKDLIQPKKKKYAVTEEEEEAEAADLHQLWVDMHENVPTEEDLQKQEEQRKRARLREAARHDDENEARWDVRLKAQDAKDKRKRLENRLEQKALKEYKRALVGGPEEKTPIKEKKEPSVTPSSASGQRRNPHERDWSKSMAPPPPKVLKATKPKEDPAIPIPRDSRWLEEADVEAKKKEKAKLKAATKDGFASKFGKKAEVPVDPEKAKRRAAKRVERRDKKKRFRFGEMAAADLLLDDPDPLDEDPEGDVSDPET